MITTLAAQSGSASVRIDKMIAELPHPQKEICLALRRTIMRIDAGVTETIKWGNPCYMLGKENVASITPYKDHVKLALFRGGELTDAEGILAPLEGTGRSMRHIKVRDTHVARQKAVSSLVKQALLLMTAPIFQELQSPVQIAAAVSS